MTQSTISRVSKIISENGHLISSKKEEFLQEIDFALKELNDLYKKELARYSIAKDKFRLDIRTNKELTKQLDKHLNENENELLKESISEQMQIISEISTLGDYLEQIDTNISNLEGFINILNAKKKVLKFESSKYTSIIDKIENLESENTYL